MADKRTKDYTKRLNYDELKDKITKNKKPINAPYRTATIVRNSNQMQNLLQMSTLEMEEHQVKLQNEQMKQAKAQDLLSGNGTSSDYQSVTSHKEHQDASEDLIDLEGDNIDLLTQADKEQKEEAIKQITQHLSETGNLASERATKTLTGGSPGEPIDAHEVDVNAIIRSVKEKAKKMTPGDIYSERSNAYKQGNLSPAQSDSWENLIAEGKQLEQEKDKEGGKELNKKILNEYVSYKLYSKGLFPTEPDAEPGKAPKAKPAAKPKGRPRKDPEQEPKPAAKPKGRPKSTVASSSTD